MKSNNIIYADLSTYSPKKTIEFYSAVFDWNYYQINDYYLAFNNSKKVSGLYETPEKFKQMRMPHFWMTYIQVNNVEQTVNEALKFGGIIELIDKESPFGTIALIRDTQGAGFTIYEGEKLQNIRTQNDNNTLIWNELHISNATSVIPFYQKIFNWHFVEKNNNMYEIHNDKNEHIADALEIPNNYKGKFEYWVCTFGVGNLQDTSDKIIANGGTIVIDEGERILFTDNSKQAFFYIKQVMQ